MTKQRTFKRKVRARMAKTGESYTAARRILVAEPEPYTPRQSDQSLVAATGHPWARWLGLLDGWGASARTHTQIARWLREEHGVPGWWAQAITVDYEHARGMRKPGQRSGGFAGDASRTVAVPVERLYEAWEADVVPVSPLTPRTVNPGRSARYDWDDGSRVVVSFEAAGPLKSRIAVTHEKLSGSEEVERMKAYWRERLAALKVLLES